MKKAGLEDAMGLVDGLYPGAAAEGLRNFPDSKTIKPPRISEVYTKGTLTLARLGREAPIAVASPAGPVLRNVEGGASTRAPSTRTNARAARAARDRRSSARRAVQYRQRAARRDHAGRAEIRDKGPWAETSAEGIVPAELEDRRAARDAGGGSAARQLGLGETTASDEPATESGIDPSAGDEADATDRS